MVNPPDNDGSGRQAPPAGQKSPVARLPPDSAVAGSDEGGDASTGTAGDGFPVVGIGASAGGIQALIRLFEATPCDTGMAFLVVMHLDPTRDSALAHILGQHTTMPVVEAADGMAIDPDCVYVIAPDASLTVAGGKIELTAPPERRGHRYPIDRLFASLALHRRERAICIVLSGTGSDGTEGLKEVKAQGGCILVQDPATAAFDGMPRSAIAANLADQVLAPEQMADALQRYIRHAYVAGPEDARDTPPDGASIDPVLALLRTRAGQDFRHYKPGTLLRRIHRRMGLNGVPAVGDYVDFLRANPAEIETLVKDLMISVTGFFRDPQAWKALDEAVLAPLVAARDDDTPVRIWIPACATGEEAYSLAILLVERAEAANKRLDIKVFATDGRDDNLDRARVGLYAEGAVATVPPERLLRFFDKLDGHYQVKRELRELVVFATHSLLRDPPFSRLDLVSCRNLLIYLGPAAQKRALALMHFALREGGHLFLGNAETVGQQDDLFEPVSKKWRIYRRVGPTRRGIIDFPALPTLTRTRQVDEAGMSEEGRSLARPAELARRALLDRFVPASVLVDGKGHALWFHGETGDYLAPPPGEPSRDLLAMARGGLRGKLSDGLRRAARERRPVTLHARVRLGGSTQAVTVIVAPVAAPEGSGSLLLVSFCKAESPHSPAAAGGRGDGHEGAGAHPSFKDELETTRAELQDTIDRLGGANEALKAANEEVTSMNEELQSTNEELETSQEEMQSFNEELQTLNSQLQHKVQEVEDAADRLSNLLAGSDVATVFLDETLCIMWFSPASTKLLDLMPSDIGRPIKNFALRVADEALLRDAETVLRDLSGIDAEVRSDTGRWYMRRLLPYRTHDNRIAGVVVTFFDITDRKQATDAVDEARIYAEAIIDTVRHPIVVLDQQLRVLSINPAFCESFACPADASAGLLLQELDHGAWDIPELRHLLHAVLTEDKPFQAFAVKHHFPRLGLRNMLLNARKLVRRGGDPRDLILLAIEDVTARVDAEDRAAILIDELNHRVKNMLAMVQSLAFQTARRSRSLDGFKEAFEGRLHALGRTHDLLVQQDWGSTELGEIVRLTFAPLEADDRIAVDGPVSYLTPEAGVAMAMVLHELMTNAVKYGALSSKSGHLQVNWRVEGAVGDEQIHLSWIESDGPPVTPPSRQGFGSSLVERTIVSQLGGTATPTFRQDGLHYEIVIPSHGNVPSLPPTKD